MASKDTKTTKTATAVKPATTVAKEVKPVVAEVKADTKKVEAPKAEVKKVEAPKAEVKKAEAPKAEVKKTEAKKAAPKKAPAKKAPAKKAEIKTNVLLQFYNKEVAESDIITNVKKAWTTQFKGKLKDIKTIDIYVKTEENKAYYVINGESTPDYFIEL